MDVGWGFHKEQSGFFSLFMKRVLIHEVETGEKLRSMRRRRGHQPVHLLRYSALRRYYYLILRHFTASHLFNPSIQLARLNKNCFSSRLRESRHSDPRRKHLPLVTRNGARTDYFCRWFCVFSASYYDYKTQSS